MSTTVFFCNPEEEFIDRVVHGLRSVETLTEVEVTDMLCNSLINLNGRDLRSKLAQEGILHIAKYMTTSAHLKDRNLRFLFVDCAFSADFLANIAKQGPAKNLKFHFRNCYFPCSPEQFRTETFEKVVEFTGQRKEIPTFIVLDVVKHASASKSK